MLNYHLIQDLQEDRLKEALRRAETNRILKSLRRPSSLRRILAAVGNVMVGLGTRLQLESSVEPTRSANSMQLINNTMDTM
jgi:hypothetical protein